MRIQHHVSILFFVAIAGAIGLALAVGIPLRGLERDARAAGKAAEQYRQVTTALDSVTQVQQAAVPLVPESPVETFASMDTKFERAVVDLAKLRPSAFLPDPSLVDAAMESLQAAMRQSRQLAEERAATVLRPSELDEFRQSIDQCMRWMNKAERAGATLAFDGDSRLTARRRTIMVTIGMVCILYMMVIERLRHWTTRRLIHPVQTLAIAAAQAMEDEQAFRGWEEGSTEELNTLARVLASFVETLKARVRQRTAEVEQQKETLEREVAVRRRAEDQLRYAAFHDRLTGLCNRDLLLDRLERCMERARRHTDYKFAVLFLDIDRFKQVNDSLGHVLGDQLLVEISERLQQCLRGTDSLSRVESNTVARIGGDEFVVLLDGIRERQDAATVAGRIQEVLGQPFQLQGQEVFTSASIGIAFNEIDCEKAEHLLRDADTAMYYAKAAGRARHEVFNKKMHDESVSRLQLHNDLQRAVEKQEFDIRYQPIVALHTGTLSGFEVLVRWRHPERGPVDPAEFIGHAEETGLIVRIGQWVLAESCRQLRAWQDAGTGPAGLTISVNVSKRQVAHPAFVDDVRRVLQEAGVEGSRLKLEITESVIMQNPDAISEVLDKLKALDVQLHMDDFGTGYSSLSYLHRFPLDVLKIDRAFMATMGASNDYKDVVQTVVALAHTLNMQVNVEGVETDEQASRLKALRCDFAQGYYFSPPLTAEDATQLMASDRQWLKTAA
jgi:diguanylate cyclase (GGDEF)-like protein